MNSFLVFAAISLILTVSFFNMTATATEESLYSSYRTQEHPGRLMSAFSHEQRMNAYKSPRSLRRYRTQTKIPCSESMFLKKQERYQNNRPHLKCQPRTNVIYLNENPSKYAYQPAVVEVKRCSGSCGRSFSDNHCVPVWEDRKHRNVTVQRLTLDEDQVVVNCEWIEVEVVDHRSCHCTYHLPCDETVRNNCTAKIEAAESRRIRQNSDLHTLEWSERECRCIEERYHSKLPLKYE